MNNINITTEINVIPISSRKELPFSLIHAGRVDSRVNEKYNRTNYERITFEFITGGSGSVTIGNQKFQPKRSDLYILPKGIRHTIAPDKKSSWSKIFFSVNGQLAEDLIRMYQLQNKFYFPGFKDDEILKKMYQLSLKPNEKIHQKAILLFHELLTEIDLYLNKDSKSHSSLVDQIKTILDEHIESHLRLNDIGRMVHKTNVHVIREFKKEMDQTPYDYLLTRRIEFAKFLLEETAMPIKQIASRLLFTDEYYFSRYFKKKTLSTPSLYRKNSRN
ncbi:MAG: hypothetical protein COA79_08050 [Planctomycetota bacterium]|nr:MAG: hypothetical protein COA79_08050 [Planctomycetota bacterium]